jgi:predicted nucleic acid-binding protein
MAAHSLAELYAILTTYPRRPRIEPATAIQLIQLNIIDRLEIVPISSTEYFQVIDQLNQQNIIGGVVYDAIILYAASKANADQILTLNMRDFRRVRPDLADKIVSP